MHRREPHPQEDSAGLDRGERRALRRPHGGRARLRPAPRGCLRRRRDRGHRARPARKPFGSSPTSTRSCSGRCSVPDGTFDAMRLPLRWFATAKRTARGSARSRRSPTSSSRSGCVSGVRVRDHTTGRDETISGDIVVNAAGPWGEKIATMAGVDVPIRPSPGVLLALRGRLCNMVVNRCHASGDGDIVVPQRALSIVGTSSWVVDDPDDLGVPEDHVERMYAEGSMLIPAVRHAERRAAWSAARPLIGARGAASGRELSRTFKCFDHRERTASKASSRSPAARRRRSGGWPRRPQTSSAPSSGSTRRAGRAIPSSCPTPPTTTA